MQNFEYCVPTKVVFGKGSVTKLPKLVPEGAKVMLIYGGGSIKRNGIYDQVKSLVKFVEEFGGIEANPDYDTCLKAIEKGRACGADFLLAVGGGSVVDATKFISAGIKWTVSEDPYDILSKWGAQGLGEYEPKAAVPFGAVLTLPATGTEMNNGAVISCRRLGEKTPVKHPGGFPTFSVLDPEHTYTLPRNQLANGIADAFVHVLEQYIFHNLSLTQDEFAEGLLRSLIRLAPSVFAEPPNYAARADFWWSTTLALNGLLSCGVPTCWGIHMLGHQLTAFYGLDHGVTLAIVLPRFYRKLKEQRAAKLGRIARHVFAVENASDPAEEAIRHMDQFFQTLGIKTTLRENGCDDRHFRAIADRFKGNPIDPESLVGAEEIYQILVDSL